MARVKQREPWLQQPMIYPRRLMYVKFALSFPWPRLSTWPAKCHGGDISGALLTYSHRHPEEVVAFSRASRRHGELLAMYLLIRELLFCNWVRQCYNQWSLKFCDEIYTCRYFAPPVVEVSMFAPGFKLFKRIKHFGKWLWLEKCGSGSLFLSKRYGVSAVRGGSRQKAERKNWLLTFPPFSNIACSMDVMRCTCYVIYPSYNIVTFQAAWWLLMG